jgi:hypothetical protein
MSSPFERVKNEREERERRKREIAEAKNKKKQEEEQRKEEEALQKEQKQKEQRQRLNETIQKYQNESGIYSLIKKLSDAVGEPLQLLVPGYHNVEPSGWLSSKSVLAYNYRVEWDYRERGRSWEERQLRWREWKEFCISIFLDGTLAITRAKRGSCFIGTYQWKGYPGYSEIERSREYEVWRNHPHAYKIIDSAPYKVWRDQPQKLEEMFVSAYKHPLRVVGPEGHFVEHEYRPDYD